MQKKATLCLFLVLNIATASCIQKLKFDLAIEPLFPGTQKIYDAKTFGNSNESSKDHLDTLVSIKDYVKWMPGYSIRCNFGKVTRLNLGLRLQYKHFFNRYYQDEFDEAEHEMYSVDIGLHLFLFQGGIYSSFTISTSFTIEPEISFLLVRSQHVYYLSSLYFPYYTHTPGISTNIKLTCIKPEKIDFGSRFTFKSYGEIIDCSIAPFIELSIIKNFKCLAVLEYSILTGAINPSLGLTIAFFGR
ncbi:MAG: hypothetical protein JW915_15155 [Chitinispirillaceae bacterium]|nr:hypothetical protein [Chitinispirillaceae bacterium]